jgi:3-hydroxy-9,10-secoandrosta-1,3,5(10)-triene-9,17-dione monooxygenase reductase component
VTTFGSTEFKEVLGRFATGITVVTAMEDGAPAGFTCQAFASLSLEPPMVVLAPAKASTSWPKMVRAGAFCANILGERQRDLAVRFSTPGDRFEGVRWRTGDAGTPILEDVLAWVECSLGAVYDAGDHELVTGTVRHLGMGGGGPLIYYRGDYGRFSG